MVLFPDGQKIAKKLCNQIGKETKAVKTLLQEYNACSDGHNIDLSEALDPCKIEGRLRGYQSWCATVATGTKRQIMDAYLGLCRSDEEICILQQEAKNLLHSYQEERALILTKLTELSTKSDPFSRGAISMLNSLLMRREVLLRQAGLLNEVLNGQVSPPDFEDTDGDFELSDDEDVDFESSDCDDEVD